MMNLNELRDQAYKTACKQYHHTTEHNNEYWLMLVIIELAEAAKAYKEKSHISEQIREELMGLQSDELYLPIFNHYTKETVEVKLSDALIRLFDLAGLKGIDLDSYYVFISDLGPDFISSIYNICRELTHSKCTLAGRIRYAIESIILLCKKMNIGLEWVIEEKMKYNSMKAYKYDKKD